MTIINMTTKKKKTKKINKTKGLKQVFFALTIKLTDFC